MVVGRPNPDELLSRVQRDESRRARGRLKIFLGMAPGVGKTYAMLAAAHRMAADGHDVVVGVAETHGRIETEQLLLGLDLLPQRIVEYRGVTLKEFDLEAAMARRPEWLIVDELAHSNAPGSRFEKRWQDIQELLDSGINVFTTLNVQHIESINDVVAQITGVHVRETIPDSVVEQAGEIELVDLTPDALIERLKAGKVYVPQTIEHAVDSFFRKGNLTALRELALRRTAEWVDRRMREYKEDQGAGAVWPAVERVLVCVSPSPSSADLVRAAKRMAAGLRADLIAAYIEPTHPERLRQPDRDRVMQTLRLAERLGAETAIVSTPPGSSAAKEVVALARSRNVTRIVIGKTGRSRWWTALFGGFMDEVIRRSGEIEVHVIRGEGDEPAGGRTALPITSFGAPAVRADPQWKDYLGSTAVVAAATAAARLVYLPPDLSEEAMVYVVGVVVVAWRFGRWPSAFASALSVGAFNFFFIEPRFTFSVDDPRHLVTFAVLLVTGLFVGTLTSRTRDQAETARQRERRTALLYAMSRELMSAVDQMDVARIAVKHLRDAFDADAAVLCWTDSSPVTPDVLASSGLPDWLDEREHGVARFAHDHGRPAGIGTRALPGAAGRHMPLMTSRGKFGVLALRPRDPRSIIPTPQWLLLETCADEVAAALERIALREAQHKAEIQTQRELLRSALLSSVSHDLRTPLAGIAGSAGALLHDEHAIDPATRRELVESIVQEAQRLNDLIGNLMFATRLEGGVEIRKEWTTIEEIVGAGLAKLRAALARRPFATSIARDLPLIRGDAAMLAQVIHNLVDNALRYTSDTTPIRISAWTTDQNVIVQVADEGSGLEPAEFGKVFERLYRGRAAKRDGQPGMGLGLTICEGIVKAHGGRIWVEANAPRGAAFHVALPIERPQPAIPREIDESPPRDSAPEAPARRATES